MAFFEDKGDSILLNVRVVPRSSADGVAGILGDALKVRIQAPPVDGKANQYLIRFLAKTWDHPRSAFTIISGQTGRNKRIRIDHPSNKVRAILEILDHESN